MTRILISSSKTSTRQSLCALSQRGMTLVELMVGILIGLIVVGAAITTLIISSSTTTNTSELTQMQQQASYALRVIGQQIRQTGAMTVYSSSTSQTSAAASTTYTFNLNSGWVLDGVRTYLHGVEGSSTPPPYVNVNGITITPQNPATPISSQPDLITVLYQARRGELSDRDCLGNRPTEPADVNASVTLTSTFFVANSGGRSALMCLGSTNSTAQPIADGVEDLQILYQVNTTPTAKTPTYAFFTGNQITGSMWGQVKAVEVCLQISSPAANVATAPVDLAPQQTQCNESLTVPNDGRLRRVFRNTFFLRNNT